MFSNLSENHDFIELLLLGTDGCHLCEQAEAILHEANIESRCTLRQIDIAEEEQRWQDYAIRIPVLYHPKTKSSLDWVFTQDDVFAFLNKLASFDQQ